ncbi:hypothetical protein [Oricola sp.]|uniref:hypothetical protein n=1 Tax=Oricola sp. TaxID=1979950 RepID=UPI003BAA73B8
MTFDLVNMTFYAIVCGALSAFVAIFQQRLRRIIVGAIVGIVAAIALPYLKMLFGI